MIRPYETRSTNHCLFASSTFSTDTPSLLFWMEGVQEVSLALGHDEPVSEGCPLYNEAHAIRGRLADFSILIQELDKTIWPLLYRIAVI